MMHSSEYHNMASVEMKHWWYRSLHKLVLQRIKLLNNSELNILDAGCGTGGMMLELINNEFRNVEGYDPSELAIEYCINNNLNVVKSTHQEILTSYSNKRFDVILCLDSMYFLTADEQDTFLKACYKLLKEGGHIIINLPALKSFSGKHDAVVGIKERISREIFVKRLPEKLFGIEQLRYWPFVLSPVIYLKRKWDLLFGSEGSDLKNSSNIINTILEFLISLEFKIKGEKFVGSSLYVELIKNNYEE